MRNPAEFFQLNRNGVILDLTCNRPTVLNSASEQWIAELHNVLDALEAMNDARVAVPLCRWFAEVNHRRCDWWLSYL